MESPKKKKTTPRKEKQTNFSEVILKQKPEE